MEETSVKLVLRSNTPIRDKDHGTVCHEKLDDADGGSYNVPMHQQTFVQGTALLHLHGPTVARSSWSIDTTTTYYPLQVRQQGKACYAKFVVPELDKAAV